MSTTSETSSLSICKTLTSNFTSLVSGQDVTNKINLINIKYKNYIINI